jgi:hypothetical protein
VVLQELYNILGKIILVIPALLLILIIVVVSRLCRVSKLAVFINYASSSPAAT